MASPKNNINKLNDISFLISKIVKDSTHVIQLKGSLMAQKLTEGKRGKKKKKKLKIVCSMLGKQGDLYVSDNYLKIKNKDFVSHH